VIVTSIDLSSAFDLVNVNLLIKRLKIKGLPCDLIQLITVWPKAYYYVSIDGSNLIFFDLLLGTVQASTLAPVLYVIFISPFFDLEELLAFADDNFILRSSN
jgi:hypothetical protein